MSEPKTFPSDELDEAPPCEDGCGCASCRERDWDALDYARDMDRLDREVEP